MKGSFHRVVILVLGAACTGGVSSLPANEPAGVLYLSDTNAADILSSTQAWGELGLDTAVRPAGRNGAPLRIGDRTYPKGLGHHASGEIRVDLAGRFQSFDAEVGVQWQGPNRDGSVVFRVFVDGRKAFDSGVMRQADPPRAVSVATKGAAELTLVVDDAGDGILCDCADWALARLTIDPAAKGERPPRPEVDVVPFGRIMTWDPAQRAGTSASRIGEFPAKDVEPGRELAVGRNHEVIAPDWNGRGCLGVQWPESRSLRRLELEFADAARASADRPPVVETWVGESPWQGEWKALGSRPERRGTMLVWEGPGANWRTPTPRVRWVFPSGDRAVVVKSVGVFTRSHWRAEEVRLERVTTSDPAVIPVEIYNGALVDSSGGDPHQIRWQASQPLNVRLLASVPRADKTDRTVLRFGGEAGGFAVSIEDVLAHGSVSYGGIRVAATAGRKDGIDIQEPAVTPGVLEDVRRRPDETLERAMTDVHRGIQDLGPMMLSLACDNRKIVADREGDVRFDASRGIDDPPRDIPDQWRLEVRPGTGGKLDITRRLHGGWLPMPTTTTREGSVVYRQTTYVAPVGEAATDRPAWVRDRAVGIVELAMRNETDTPAPARLTLALAGTGPAPGRATMAAVDGTTIFSVGDRVLAIAEAAAGPLSLRQDAGGLTLSGSLPPNAESGCTVLVPLWPLRPGEKVVPPAGTTWEERTTAYWKAVLSPSMQVDLPDPFLADLIRASQVHCLLAARSEDSGRRVAAWISSDRYGPLESEAHAPIRGMDMLGQSEYARRSLEFFIRRYSPEGFLTTGYTLVGTGEHLWTLAEHVERTHDEAWLRSIAPELKRVCAWIIRQRTKTKRVDEQGRKRPGYGLMPPGVSADWNRFAYRFFNDAQYSAGLTAAARILSSIRDPAADALAKEADAYREDLRTAYRWTQSRSPVLPLGDGAWTLAQSALLDSYGHVEEFLPGEDANRSWAYSVDLGAHHLAATGILDPGSPEVGGMLGYLEGSAFLRTGMGEYPEGASRKDPYGLGGFAKVQPFYARVAEIYAARDDVKPFLRAYFHGLASLVSRENMSFWEHFHNQGGWNKTHETGWFLCQTRLMLVQERGEDLWLAPFVTDRWLGDGRAVSVRDAPTRFGKVGYAIRSHVGEGFIEATIAPPTGPAEPRRILLRLRHPEGKPMRSVTVSGRPHGAFDPKSETITLAPTGPSLRVRVEY
ncbi:NPCBM/NEW2 domain-containing protein [Aquisphaera insulae]|uniref:NPCBM/NEW2 domain-containing protein n=1 Tax=Aquisphaera insulae TaxID=2712864 RepID=UPI0013EBED64|nr:NPCBM/NEW2 domain-containing protein [Aquisphaera insulae]